MRIGVTLPSFRDDASAVDAAVLAERLGLDGVFVFDHLWPIGQARPPGAERDATARRCRRGNRSGDSRLSGRTHRPVARRRSRRVTSLIAHDLGREVHRGARRGGPSERCRERSPTESRYAPHEERLASLKDCATRLIDFGVTVWIGGRARTIEIARDVGAVANLWERGP